MTKRRPSRPPVRYFFGDYKRGAAFGAAAQQATTRARPITLSPHAGEFDRKMLADESRTDEK